MVWRLAYSWLKSLGLGLHNKVSMLIFGMHPNAIVCVSDKYEISSKVLKTNLLDSVRPISIKHIAALYQSLKLHRKLLGSAPSSRQYQRQRILKHYALMYSRSLSFQCLYLPIITLWIKINLSPKELLLSYLCLPNY